RNVDTVLRSDNPPYRPYAISDAAELLGQAVTAVTAGPTSPWRVTVNEPERLATYQPDNGLIPSRVSGAVTGPAENERPTIAVALNGRIAGVVETHRLDDVTHRFEAMVAPDLFIPGLNQF